MRKVITLTFLSSVMFTIYNGKTKNVTKINTESGNLLTPTAIHNGRKKMPAKKQGS